MALRYVSLLLLLLHTHLAIAHTDTVRGTSFFSFRYENDFFSATDRYYTQGIQFTLQHQFLRKSPVFYVLLKPEKADFRQYGISAKQQCFTPRSIRNDSIYFHERPYASVALLTHYVKNYFQSTQRTIESKLDLGIIGPCALCEEEQKGLHRMLDNIQPLGWEYQLKTDFIINYTLRHEKVYYRDKVFNFSFGQQVRAGTLFTDADVYAQTRIGRFPKFGEHVPAGRKFLAFTQISSGIKLVGYNSTLQGGLLSNSIYTLPAQSVERIILWSKIGFILRLRNLQVEYFYSALTPEFKSGLQHAWGGITLRGYW